MTTSRNDAKILNKIKTDPRVESVWDEEHDGWFCELKPGWCCELTDCGTCHEETLEQLLAALGCCYLRN